MTSSSISRRSAAEPSLAVLVQHVGSEDVDAVMVNGSSVLRAVSIQGFNENDAIADPKQQAAAIRIRAASRIDTLHAAMPGMKAQFLRTCG